MTKADMVVDKWTRVVDIGSIPVLWDFRTGFFITNGGSLEYPNIIMETDEFRVSFTREGYYEYPQVYFSSVDYSKKKEGNIEFVNAGSVLADGINFQSITEARISFTNDYDKGFTERWFRESFDNLYNFNNGMLFTAFLNGKIENNFYTDTVVLGEALIEFIGQDGTINSTWLKKSVSLTLGVNTYSVNCVGKNAQQIANSFISQITATDETIEAHGTIHNNKYMLRITMFQAKNYPCSIKIIDDSSNSTPTQETAKLVKLYESSGVNYSFNGNLMQFLVSVRKFNDDDYMLWFCDAHKETEGVMFATLYGILLSDLFNTPISYEGTQKHYRVSRHLPAEKVKIFSVLSALPPRPSFYSLRFHFWVNFNVLDGIYFAYPVHECEGGIYGLKLTPNSTHDGFDVSTLGVSAGHPAGFSDWYIYPDGVISAPQKAASGLYATFLNDYIEMPGDEGGGSIKCSITVHGYGLQKTIHFYSTFTALSADTLYNPFWFNVNLSCSNPISVYGIPHEIPFTEELRHYISPDIGEFGRHPNNYQRREFSGGRFTCICDTRIPNSICYFHTSETGERTVFVNNFCGKDLMDKVELGRNHYII